MIIQLVLIQIVAFVFIVGIMRLLFGTQLKTALNRLQTLHQESLAKEEMLNKELERARVQCESEIARGKEEAKVIIDTAKKNSEKIALEANAKSQLEAKKLIDEAREHAQRREAEVLTHSDEKATSTALELIQGVFSDKGQEVLQSQLIGELLDELEKVDKSQLPVKEDTAVVTTVLKLSAKEVERIKTILSEKLSHDVKVEQKTDPSIITGIVIGLGGLVIDGSLANKLNKVLNALRAKRG